MANSLAELLYERLMASPAFHHWVRRVHARINGIPYNVPHPNRPFVEQSLDSFTPTRYQKWNAFRVVWIDELKRTFSIR